MANNNLPALKNALNAPSVKAKFEEMLGKRSSQFMTSITSVVSNNALLQKADVNSIIMGAAVAASMDLPLHPALGYAALVPFNSKEGCFAQLQVMAKGLTELFLRSGQCQSLINTTVYEGQLIKKNKFTGEYVFDEDAKKSDKIIGFVAYFRLLNGFEKYEYMTVQEVKEHAQKFSQTYRKNAGVWRDNFTAMGEKTVLRRLLSKWAPKSLELQKAMIFDQAVVNGDISNVNQATASYVDNGGKVEDEVVVEDFEETVDVVEEIVDENTGEITQQPTETNNNDLDF